MIDSREKLLKLVIYSNRLCKHSKWLEGKIIEKTEEQLELIEKIPNEGIKLAFKEARQDLQIISDILSEFGVLEE